MKLSGGLKLLLSLLLTMGVGSLSGLLTVKGVNGWYQGIEKPFFNPPNWLFGPVWTVLYLMMGISLYLIWNKADSPVRSRAMTFFFLQLFLNFCWSPLFFLYQQPFLAFIEIILMWVAILFTIRSASRLSRPAAYLLVPYLFWVSFATVLNGAIFWLNRG